MLLDPKLVTELHSLFSDKLLVEIDAPDADLLQTGVLDSLKLVELLLHLEQDLGVSVPMDELDTEDFRSLDSIARLVASRRALEPARVPFAEQVARG